ncbi:unnamed protein product [Schistocephalus solidus]|uniref:Uncharacterized protein n=1 Tax=Schistocephalus solidus TaxID=70667 RepID=A0A183STC1_SCHSO|nr:unnamed protein product [Schistocephalus solidus]
MNSERHSRQTKSSSRYLLLHVGQVDNQLSWLISAVGVDKIGSRNTTGTNVVTATTPAGPIRQPYKASLPTKLKSGMCFWPSHPSSAPNPVSQLCRHCPELVKEIIVEEPASSSLGRQLQGSSADPVNEAPLG